MSGAAHETSKRRGMLGIQLYCFLNWCIHLHALQRVASPITAPCSHHTSQLYLTPYGFHMPTSHTTLAINVLVSHHTLTLLHLTHTHPHTIPSLYCTSHHTSSHHTLTLLHLTHTHTHTIPSLYSTSHYTTHTTSHHTTHTHPHTIPSLYSKNLNSTLPNSWKSYNDLLLQSHYTINCFHLLSRFAAITKRKMYKNRLLMAAHFHEKLMKRGKPFLIKEALD